MTREPLAVFTGDLAALIEEARTEFERTNQGELVTRGELRLLNLIAVAEQHQRLLASPPVMREQELRHAWEAGFALCRNYGDNHAYFDGKQKERQWQEYMETTAALAQPPVTAPTDDAPPVVVFEFSRWFTDLEWRALIDAARAIGFTRAHVNAPGVPKLDSSGNAVSVTVTRECAHGHRKRVIGCVSCVLVSDNQQPPVTAPAAMPPVEVGDIVNGGYAITTAEAAERLTKHPSGIDEIARVVWRRPAPATKEPPQ